MPEIKYSTQQALKHLHKHKAEWGNYILELGENSYHLWETVIVRYGYDWELLFCTDSEEEILQHITKNYPNAKWELTHKDEI